MITGKTAAGGVFFELQHLSQVHGKFLAIPASIPPGPKPRAAHLSVVDHLRMLEWQKIYAKRFLFNASRFEQNTEARKAC